MTDVGRAVRSDIAGQMAAAASVLLGSLEEDQRAEAHWVHAPGTALGDAERLRWFYTPTDHGGLALSAMNGAQQRHALALLRTGVSPAAYNTVSTIIGLENVLDAQEGFRLRVMGRERARDPGLYYVRVFGRPGETGAWAWRFGGHHVSINHLVVDGVLSATTPLFLGASPAHVPLLGGHELRPLAAVEDLARELVRSLQGDLAASAIISPRAPLDLVSGNRTTTQPGDVPLTLADLWRDPLSQAAHEAAVARTRDEETEIGFGPEHLELVRMPHAPAGVRADRLGAGQQELLRALLDTYLMRVPDELARVESLRFAGDGLNALHFAWAGSTERNAPHYYRIAGPRLMVEYDNAQNGANHVHSVWRDPSGDFGLDLLGEHLRSHH